MDALTHLVLLLYWLFMY